MGKIYNNLISTTAGFNYAAKQPLDDRAVVQSYEDLATLVSDNLTYDGMRVYVVDKEKSYMLVGGEWLIVATEDYVDGKADANTKAIDEHIKDTDNPHEVTKEQVGLGEVINTGDSATPTENGTTKFTTGGAYTELAKKVDKIITINNHALSDNITLKPSDLGLGNVENKSSDTIRGELTKDNVTDALGYTPPETDTTYDIATSDDAGLVKIGYVENDKNYPVELSNDNKMFVSVPWTDTTYTVDVTGEGNAITEISQSGSDITATKGATFLTSETPLSKAKDNGAGNAVTDISVSGHEITLTKGETFIPDSEKGSANGVATLDVNGHVPSTQLPSYVDDVIEGYINDDKNAFYSDEDETEEITAESGKIYLDIFSLKTYRWGGTKYAEISESLALGETGTTAYYGDKGKVAYDHSQAAHAPIDAQANIIESIKVNDTVLTITSKTVDIAVPTGALADKDKVAKTDLEDDFKTEIENKVDSEEGKSLSTNDLTDELKSNYNAAYAHSQDTHAPVDAEKNQNAFSNIIVGEDIVEADGPTDSLTLEGSNVTLTLGDDDNKVTIGITKDNVTTALGYTPPETVYTHPDTHPATMITGLADVATSGSYDDLSNKPTTLSRFDNDAGYITKNALVNPDFAALDPADKAYIKNMPMGYRKPEDKEYRNVSGGASVNINFENHQYVNGIAELVSNDTYTRTDLIGATVFVLYSNFPNFAPMYIIQRENIVEETSNGIWFKFGNSAYNMAYIFVVYTNKYKPSAASQNFPEPGIYFSSSDMGDATYVNKLIINISSIRKLDNRFVDLPNNADFNALEDKVQGIRSDLTGYAKSTDIPTSLSDLNEDANHRTVTDAEKTAWNTKSDFSGSYDDLSDRPFYDDGTIDIEISREGVSIPLTNGDAYLQTEKAYTLEQMLGATGERYFSSGFRETFTLSEENLIDNTSDGLTFYLGDYVYIFVAYTTNYKPDVASTAFPKAGVYFSDYDDGDSYYVRSVSKELGFKKLDNKFLDLPNNEDFKELKTEINEKSDFSGDYEDLTNKPTIPTKTSQLTNDSGFKTTDNNTTYSISKSNSTITLTGSDGSTASVTDDDTKVTNTLATTTKAYVTGTTSATTNTGTQVFDTGVYLGTAAGELYAKEFKIPDTSGVGNDTMLSEERLHLHYGDYFAQYTTDSIAGYKDGSMFDLSFPNLSGTLALTSQLMNFKLHKIKRGETFEITPGMMALILPYGDYTLSAHKSDGTTIVSSMGATVVMATEWGADADNPNNYWVAFLHVKKATLMPTMGSNHNSYTSNCYIKNNDSGTTGTGYAYVYYLSREQFKTV